MTSTSVDPALVDENIFGRYTSEEIAGLIHWKFEKREDLIKFMEALSTGTLKRELSEHSA